MFLILLNFLFFSPEFNSFKKLQDFQDLQKEKGEKLFFRNCMTCHVNGNNIIIPEKNLQKETLDILGINNINSLTYQIINGKNGMPGFGGRLKQQEIEDIVFYILK